MISSRRNPATAILVWVAVSVLAVTCPAAQAGPDAGFVRLESVESGATPNDHPASIAPSVVGSALARIRLEGLMKADEPIFSDSELSKILPDIASALGTAKPNQDVAFAVFGRHGTFGENSPATVTTGRMFVAAGHLNVILGLIHTRYEDPDFGRTPTLTPGRRAKRIAPVGTLMAEGANTVDMRGDWLRFDVAKLATTSKTAAPVPAPTPGAASQKVAPAEARHQEIQSRLKLLDRLKADGLITEDEYRELRLTILKSI